MLRPSPNHGTQRLPNDDDDYDDSYNIDMHTSIYILDNKFNKCSIVLIIFRLQNKQHINNRSQRNQIIVSFLFEENTIFKRCCGSLRNCGSKSVTSLSRMPYHRIFV